MRTWLVCIAALAVLFALGTESAYAQNAQIIGTVKDQTGAIVPGATVTARNQETGLTRTDVTNQTGNFRLPVLPPGTYKVTVELSGFTTETRPDILLVIEQTAIINFTLKPATVAETVTVTGESPIVDTTRSDVSTSVSTDQIQHLPVASRRWIDLAMLVPGTSQDNIRGFFYRGNANLGGGLREYSNMFVVDGVNNTWAEMGEARQNFAMDSIREFKVSTSNYKAEYGLATGGLLTVVSRSGTNELHGSGLLFFRDKSLTAKEYFQTTKPDYRRYQYGATIGGPIVKDKTHFFFAVEGTNENQYFTVYAKGLWPQYEGTYASKQNRWTYTAKVDHQLKQNQTMFFRLAQENEYRPVITAGGRTHTSNAFDFAVPRMSAVVGHTWIISDRTLNDFRFQYAFSKYEVAAPYSHDSFAAGDFTERIKRCTPVFTYPSIAIGGCGNSQMGPEKRFEFRDDYSYLKTGWGGTHQWKTGVDYSYIPFESDNLGAYYGTFTFPKDKPYDPNDKTTWPTQFNQTRPRYADVPTQHFAAYVQDDWEAGHNLTFNLGLRYDIQKGSFNENLPELQKKIEEKMGSGLGYPAGTDWYNTWYKDNEKRGDRNNFGPRIGFAWDPTASGTLNVHAGYGVFYDNIRTLMNFDEIWWPQMQQIVISNPSFPDAFGGRPRSDFLLTPNITVMDRNFKNAWANQVNAGMTKLLARNLAVTADVTMTWRYDDRDTTWTRDVNLPDPVTKVKPYPQFGRVTMLESSTDSAYKALLVKIEKRLSNRHQFMVSYTLSKSDDSFPTNLLADFWGYKRVTAPATADRRHRLVASGMVQLPLDIQLSAIGDFRSSLPFNTGTSYDLNKDGYTGDLPAGATLRSGCRTLNLDAINAFRTSRGLAAVSQSAIACPGFANVDLRLSKFFQLGGQRRIELIGQLFNISDRANFETPTGNPGSTIFGQVAALRANINAPSRQAELAIRFQF